MPALAFVDGGPTLLLAGSIFLGSVFSWTLLAKRLRRYTIAAENSLTISEFLERRFDDRTGILRSLVAIFTLFFVTIYISSGLVGGSKLLQEIFGLSPNIGIVLTLIAVASYTLVGGFWRYHAQTCSNGSHAGLLHHHSRNASLRDRLFGPRDGGKRVRIPESVQLMVENDTQGNALS